MCRIRAFFDFPLVGIVGEAQEVKVVWVFKCLLSQGGLWVREERGKIGDRGSLALPEAGFEILLQGIAGPAPGDCMDGIPFTL